MELTILGSGSADARADRGQSGYVIRDGETQIVIDAGSGNLGRCCRAGLDPGATTAFLITHGHPDHVADLVPFLFEIKHHGGGGRTEDLVVHGPPTFTSLFNQLMEIFGQWCVGETYDVVAREVERETIRIGSLRVIVRPMAHSLPAVGYRVEDGKGHAVAYTGDTGPAGELAELVRGADVLLADCTLPADKDFDGHLNASQAGRIAQEGGVRTLVLTHLSPDADEEDLESQARAHFEGQVTRARDLLSIAF